MPRMFRSVPGAAVAAACVLLIAASPQIGAQTPRTLQDGVFSDAQASRGQSLYGQRCAGCHGPALEGAQAAPLVGEGFTAKFRTEPLSALFIQIRYAMPPGGAAGGELTAPQAADLVAHVLKSNGFAAGKADFAATDAADSQTAWPALPARRETITPDKFLSSRACWLAATSNQTSVHFSTAMAGASLKSAPV
jgi:mono/diheme cytochrome c family protein